MALALALLPGCAASGETEPAPSGAPGEEQRLVLYTSHKEEVWWPIVKEFEERTGVWVDVVSGGTNEILDRIAGEAERPAADVMFGGGVESLESYRDCFTPYACAGQGELLEQCRSRDDLWTPFSSLPVVLVYNTKLMAPDRVTSWADLLSPELRGKGAFADPGVSGSSFTALVTLVSALGGGEETLRAFAANLDGRQLEGSGDVLTAVAEGDFWVGVTLEETALQHIAAGEDLALVYPAEGTSAVPDGSALVKGAPHPENARRFLDFTVSREVQELLAGRFCRRPVRAGVEPGLELPGLEELPLAEYDLALASEEHDSLLMTWAFYLGKEETP